MGTPDQVREYYDRNAGVYDEKTGFDLDSGQSYNFRVYYEPFLQSALPTTGRVLELGCGTGFYTEWLANRGTEVVAVDISPNMVERARERCPPSVSFHVGNCEDPGEAMGPEAIGDGFDAIVGVNTFSYYEDKPRALRNFRELLREGGRLVLLDMNGTSWTQRLAYLLNYREARRFRDTVDDSTPARLTSLLEGAAFGVDSIRRLSFVPNGIGPRMVTVLGVFDRLLARLEVLDRFAVRLAVVAHRI